MNEYALYILAGTNVLLAAIIARHSNIMQELTPMIKSVFEKLKDIDCEETVADDKEFQSQKPED